MDCKQLNSRVSFSPNGREKENFAKLVDSLNQFVHSTMDSKTNKLMVFVWFHLFLSAVERLLPFCSFHSLTNDIVARVETLKINVGLLENSFFESSTKKPIFFLCVWKSLFVVDASNCAIRCMNDIISPFLFNAQLASRGTMLIGHALQQSTKKKTKTTKKFRFIWFDCFFFLKK